MICTAIATQDLSKGSHLALNYTLFTNDSGKFLNMSDNGAMTLAALHITKASKVPH